MHRRHFATFGMALVIGMAGPACADDMFDHTRHYKTTAGQEVRIGAHARWDRKCQPKGAPNIVVTQAPQHGAVSTRPGTHIVKESIGGSICNGREVAGIVVIYTPTAGFVGTDTLVYTVAFGADVVTNNVTVAVQ